MCIIYVQKKITLCEYVHNKDPVVQVRVWWTMDNNPACTEHVRVFSMLKMDTMQNISNN